MRKTIMNRRGISILPGHWLRYGGPKVNHSVADGHWLFASE
jgi:hypothetical protein